MYYHHYYFFNLFFLHSYTCIKWKHENDKPLHRDYGEISHRYFADNEAEAQTQQRRVYVVQAKNTI